MQQKLVVKAGAKFTMLAINAPGYNHAIRGVIGDEGEVRSIMVACRTIVQGSDTTMLKEENKMAPKSFLRLILLQGKSAQNVS